MVPDTWCMAPGTLEHNYTFAELILQNIWTAIRNWRLIGNTPCTVMHLLHGSHNQHCEHMWSGVMDQEDHEDYCSMCDTAHTQQIHPEQICIRRVLTQCLKGAWVNTIRRGSPNALQLVPPAMGYKPPKAQALKITYCSQGGSESREIAHPQTLKAWKFECLKVWYFEIWKFESLKFESLKVCKFESLKVWSLKVWKFESVRVWKFESLTFLERASSLAVWKFESLTIRRRVIWLPASVGMWLYGCMAAWLYGYMARWLYGYMTTWWLSGFMAIWLHGYYYTAIWLRSCMDRCQMALQLHVYTADAYMPVRLHDCDSSSQDFKLQTCKLPHFQTFKLSNLQTFRSVTNFQTSKFHPISFQTSNFQTFELSRFEDARFYFTQGSWGRTEPCG